MMTPLIYPNDPDYCPDCGEYVALCCCDVDDYDPFSGDTEEFEPIGDGDAT